MRPKPSPDDERIIAAAERSIRKHGRANELLSGHYGAGLRKGREL